jgi:HJR/Mrr/RecB family endonuclease
MDKNLSASSLIKSMVHVTCTKETRINKENKDIDHVVVICFLNLIGWIMDNPEFKETYVNNPQFHIIIDYISQGVTAPELLSLIKDLCKSNEVMQDQMVEMIKNSPLSPVIIKK